MKFFHISHTDLDGYSCQLITKKLFHDGFYYNANYGAEVKTSIEVVLKEVLSFKDEEIFFLISDLNLNIDEAKSLKNLIFQRINE